MTTSDEEPKQPQPADQQKAPLLKNYWDIHDCQRMVGVSARTMYRWFDQGLPRAVIAGRVFVKPEDVKDFIAGKFEQPEPPKRSVGRKRRIDGGR